MALDIDSALGIHAQALALRERRATILAQNLANADTPGYHARDVDFRAALTEAADGQAQNLHATRGGHLSGRPTAAGDALLYRVPSQPAVDGNTVEPHVENAAFLDNALRYQASLVFLDGRIRSLRLAMSNG